MSDPLDRDIKTIKVRPNLASQAPIVSRTTLIEVIFNMANW